MSEKDVLMLDIIEMRATLAESVESVESVRQLSKWDLHGKRLVAAAINNLEKRIDEAIEKLRGMP